MFTTADLHQLNEKGIRPAEAEKQIFYFKEGIDFIRLIKPAIPGDGIDVFTEKQKDALVDYFEKQGSKIDKIKFVPASGAASRMFRDLYEAKEKMPEQDAVEENPGLKDFFDGLPAYPFYSDLEKAAKEQGEDMGQLMKEKKYGRILSLLLEDEGLNYGHLPKGLLKFHNYGKTSRTAFEEHFEEAAGYLADEKGVVKLHFTVSPEHLEFFRRLTTGLQKHYLEKKGKDFRVSFSEQKPSTDTISVDLDNHPFRDEEGKLLFRPGGHGALLDNLGDLDEPVVFLGNIDNVAPDRLKGNRIRHKKFLGGYLLDKVHQIHKFLDDIQQGTTEREWREQLTDFIREISPEEAILLSKSAPDVFHERAYHILNRPVRVCGMVKNVGEPGGGPFWIEEKSGRTSKQIIESSQIDLSMPEQQKIFRLSTHFNPVDIACYIRDYKGSRFDLKKFRDPDMGFISKKSFNGKDLKALELPGLWNGSMAGWITYFTEVPLETFSPVKTIFDLMRDEHR